MERRASKTLESNANGHKQSHWVERGDERPVKCREHIIVIGLHLLAGVDLRLL